MTNREIAEVFEKVADMLAIRGDQIHRILAYRRAAESIRGLSRDLKHIQAEGELTEVHGIGQTLAAKIEEMLTTGGLAFYDKLAKEIPPALVELMRIEGLGPKRIKQIYDSLGITTLEELAAAAEAGKLRNLPGLGEKSETKIKESIAALQRHGDDRTLLGTAWPIAQEILAELQAVEGVTQSAVGGSLRRMRETIGDVDLLVASQDSAPVMERFRSLSSVETVLGSGPTKTTVQLLNGLQVDLRVLPAERWGTLLVYFTGNKEHNVKLREMALKKGYSLNEHSFTPLNGGEELLCATEEEVYAVLGLPTILPTLREDRGEIEAALQGKLPVVVRPEEILADLHMHTTWSDGRLPVLEMAQAAKAWGYRYIAITDHSASLGVVKGMDTERLLAQAEEIRAANEALGPDFRVLHGTEMEIKADGTLDYPDEALAQLDFVIASLHTSLKQPQEDITARLLAAIENPHVDMIGHPTGRLLPERQGADLEMEAVLQAAARTGTILEINANPRRLDLRDVHVRRAIELGVKLSINTDAHHPDQFDLMHYGVATAQRGWATAAEVVNTWPVEKLLAYLNR
ncbi:MAG: DNA polymerase/3'-5' exonuclease PolX [Chloroflexi bacterium]|nr:DNA polymerase/3'-5' exonuclease PolX [Chloroflexota bacterium]MCI0576143.1 DNA polymerase/3'-5' exonuclease PolX [Chloroflexota bacterium]MCI0647931.1 DNA polymerase/3'-5' exonuclease PolX [Chloroflexota bacterium]MCI0727182.1 DNA polymerase/3'-5' exonuclease PolX [Chloroflexota bacterium]